MAKIEKRVVNAAPAAAVSATLCESGPAQEQYVWDPSKRQKQDPFFAVTSIVQALPRMSMTADDDTKVSITF
jgi:hypothetical protein